MGNSINNSGNYKYSCNSIYFDAAAESIGYRQSVKKFGMSNVYGWFIVVLVLMTSVALYYAGTQVAQSNDDLQGLVTKYGGTITKVKSLF